MKNNRSTATMFGLLIMLCVMFAGQIHGEDGKLVILKQVELGMVKPADYSGEAAALVMKLKGTDGANIRIYGNDTPDTLLVESCASEGKLKTGIYLIENRRDLRHFPQYDPKFSAWACAEECDSASDCYYVGLKNRKNDRFQGLLYFYYVNLSEGYYNLKLLKDRIKVIDSSRYDYPS